MKATCTSIFDAAPGDVEGILHTTEVLRFIAAPLILFTSRERGGFPALWEPGKHRVFMWFLGFIPFGPQTVDISWGRDEAGDFWIRDDGSGLLVRRWDHRITVRPAPDGKTLYTDNVEIGAGILTPFVWAFASVFY
ncbi:MAG: hypothetical protein K2Q06_10950, partial [Parvularculaceae bacterium]|nr:hypothetical protein [Parvularculaceae bacterium]